MRYLRRQFEKGKRGKDESRIKSQESGQFHYLCNHTNIIQIITMLHQFSPENQLIIAACSPAPNPILLQQTISKIDNWDKATAKLIKKGVAPLFLDILEKNQLEIPQEVKAKLRQAYLKTVSRSMLLYDAFREIAEALNKEGIQAVALKGIYLAEQLYPKIGLRQFSDIDLLFRNEDVEKALVIFAKLGFTMVTPEFGEAVTTNFESAHLPPLTRKGVSVEVHTRLHGPTFSYRLPEREMMERAERVIIHGQAFLAFGLIDQLIHLCLHLDKHFNGSHMQLYSLADIALLVAQRGHEIDGTQLALRCREYKAEKEVGKILGMVEVLFGVHLPANWDFTYTDEMAALQQLEHHLNDTVAHNPGTRTHLFFIRKIKSTRGKLNYLREVLFPGKRFMLLSYPIKNKQLFWLWYPYRTWVGLKGLFRKK